MSGDGWVILSVGEGASEATKLGAAAVGSGCRSAVGTYILGCNQNKFCNILSLSIYIYIIKKLF